MFVYPTSLNQLHNPCVVFSPSTYSDPFMRPSVNIFTAAERKVNWSSVWAHVEGPAGRFALRTCRLFFPFFFFALCNGAHQVYSAKDNKPRRGIPVFGWTTGSQPQQQARTCWQPRFQRRRTRTWLSARQSLGLGSSCIFPSQWNEIIYEEKAATPRR